MYIYPHMCIYFDIFPMLSTISLFANFGIILFKYKGLKYILLQYYLINAYTEKLCNLVNCALTLNVLIVKYCIHS